MTHQPGALIKARGREWVVLPDSTEEILLVRPLGGSDDEVTGISLEVEGADVVPAEFAPPDPEKELGDYQSGRLLRDAALLHTRSVAGPFRSLGRIAVEPRPYQLVPLLMALKQETVRLLIADDVGVGKTIEACLIARELYDRHEIRSFTVLAPPHLAPQWVGELNSKFHIDAKLVLPSTARQLERGLGGDESIFTVYPFTVVSTDYIKSERHRHNFLVNCPDLVIVDEAHTCVSSGIAGGGRHLRHKLLKDIVKRPDQHTIFVTATPHTGQEEGFRNLIEMLNPEFADFPDDLSGKQNEKYRRALAKHIVQRQRGDIEAYVDEQTTFPDREKHDAPYALTPEYRKVFDDTMKFATERVRRAEGQGEHRVRMHWWAALGLLRSMASSPRAAAATLTNRFDLQDADAPVADDQAGALFDLDLDEGNENDDLVPVGDASQPDDPDRSRAAELAERALALSGKDDPKLQLLKKVVKTQLAEGRRVIVFCRFIATAEYVAEHIASAKGVRVECVTGKLPPAEREERVNSMADAEQRVLVATDCLSEGVNLHDLFDTVIHYDLAWSPTRHEQREGRVDRFGQAVDKVRALTIYGQDNGIDGIVLKILLRKESKIEKSLGIRVAVPEGTNDILSAILQGELIKERKRFDQLSLDSFGEDAKKAHAKLNADWDHIEQVEIKWRELEQAESNTIFRQQTIDPEEVKRELEAARKVVGRNQDMRRFVLDALKLHKAHVDERTDRIRIDLGDVSRSLLDHLQQRRNKDGQVRVDVAFTMPWPEGVKYLTRTHAFVEGLSTYVLETALDEKLADEAVAKRCGAYRTTKVSKRTTLLVLRHRFDLEEQRANRTNTELVEEIRVVAFEGDPTAPTWLADDQVEPLLNAPPDGANMPDEQKRQFLSPVIEALPVLSERLMQDAHDRAQKLVEAHERVRTAGRGSGRHLARARKPDVLGVYVLTKGGAS